jgi:hypothetical protein
LWGNVDARNSDAIHFLREKTMSYGTTKKHAEEAFNRLCKALGKSTTCISKDKTGPIVWNVGAWRLDYYSGYRVEEISNENGGAFWPLNQRHITASEFCYACDFAIEVLHIAGK